MRSEDKDAFADAMAQTFSIYNTAVSRDLMSAWWAVLQPYTLDAVRAAMMYHIGDYEGHGYRAPTPSDIRRHLEVTLPALAAARSSEVLASVAPEIEIQRDKIATAETLHRLGHINLEEVQARCSTAAATIREIQARPEIVQARAGLNLRDDGAGGQAYGTKSGRLAPLIRKAIRVLTGTGQ